LPKARERTSTSTMTQRSPKTPTSITESTGSRAAAGSSPSARSRTSPRDRASPCPNLQPCSFSASAWPARLRQGKNSADNFYSNDPRRKAVPETALPFFCGGEESMATASNGAAGAPGVRTVGRLNEARPGSPVSTRRILFSVTSPCVPQSRCIRR